MVSDDAPRTWKANAWVGVLGLVLLHPVTLGQVIKATWELSFLIRKIERVIKYDNFLLRWLWGLLGGNEDGSVNFFLCIWQNTRSAFLTYFSVEYNVVYYLHNVVLPHWSSLFTNSSSLLSPLQTMAITILLSASMSSATSDPLYECKHAVCAFVTDSFHIQQCPLSSSTLLYNRISLFSP